MLAILTTHPIQYQAPIWQELAHRRRVPFEVWYLSNRGAEPVRDVEFGRTFRWDVDLLAGYPHRQVGRPARDKVQTFMGARLGQPFRLLRERGVRALWINGWQVSAYWQAALCARALGIPVWLRGETNDLRAPTGVKRPVRRALLGGLFRTIDRFLYIGSANRRFYRSFGVDEDRLVPAPYGVDNVRFRAAVGELGRRRAELRAAWRIPPGAACFLFSGKLIPKKRPLDLLDAINRLLSSTPADLAQRIHVLIVGDGELRSVMEARAAALEPVAGRRIVTFAGFLNQTEIPRAYVAADWLVLPSDSRETWGLVVNEALACGRPAIVSDQCGCAEDLALPMGADHIYPCGDVMRLSECLRAGLMRPVNEQTSARLAQLADAYGLDHTVRSVECLYSDLVGNTPEP